MLKTYCISKVEPMELTGKVDFRCEEKRSYLMYIYKEDIFKGRKAEIERG